MEAEDLGLLHSPSRNDVSVETADKGQSLITQILSEYLDLSKYLHHNGDFCRSVSSIRAIETS